MYDFSLYSSAQIVCLVVVLFLNLILCTPHVVKSNHTRVYFFIF